jgi:hypothetical protein
MNLTRPHLSVEAATILSASWQSNSARRVGLLASRRHCRIRSRYGASLRRCRQTHGDRRSVNQQGLAGDRCSGRVGYEAGYDGFGCIAFSTRDAFFNHVPDAASRLVNRKARRAKTDRLDAEKLVRMLMAHWRREPRSAKRLHRYRQFLMKERVQHIGRIKGLVLLSQKVAVRFHVESVLSGDSPIGMRGWDGSSRI